jgi:hypothetical protein
LVIDEELIFDTNIFARIEKKVVNARYKANLKNIGSTSKQLA